MDDYVDYLKAPVGTWDGKTYRISIDGDCHNFNYRTDVFSDPGLAEAWKADGNTRASGACPRPGQQVQAVTKFLKGKTDPTFGTPLNGYPRPAQGLGRLRLLLPRGPRHRLRQVSRTTRRGSSTPTR